MSVPYEDEANEVENIVCIFKKMSADWRINFQDLTNSANAKQCAFNLTLNNISVSIRIVSLFSSQIVIYVKNNGTCRAVNILSTEQTENNEINSRRMVFKLTTTIFAPLFRPHSEYQSLGQLSTTALTMICAFLTVS